MSCPARRVPRPGTIVRASQWSSSSRVAEVLDAAASNEILLHTGAPLRGVEEADKSIYTPLPDGRGSVIRGYQAGCVMGPIGKVRIRRQNSQGSLRGLGRGSAKQSRRC